VDITAAGIRAMRTKTGSSGRCRGFRGVAHRLRGPVGHDVGEVLAVEVDLGAVFPEVVQGRAEVLAPVHRHPAVVRAVVDMGEVVDGAGQVAERACEPVCLRAGLRGEPQVPLPDELGVIAQLRESGGERRHLLAQARRGPVPLQDRPDARVARVSKMPSLMAGYHRSVIASS
jgi:hypothetical protein